MADTSECQSDKTVKEEPFQSVKTRKRRKNDKEEEMDTVESRARPSFPPVKAQKLAGGKSETRKIPVPSHRYTPLKENWMKIFTPVVEHLKLQIRFNLGSRHVEIR
ncbi:predicted protein, partial [Nematostella vectensis]